MFLFVCVSHVVGLQVEASLLVIGFRAIVRFVDAVCFSIFPGEFGKSK